MYYSPVKDVYLCVVVTPANENEYFVVTAYYTTNIKKGKELWRS